MVAGFGGTGGARGSEGVSGEQAGSGGGGGGGYYGAGGAGGPQTLVNMTLPAGSAFPTTGPSAGWAVDGNANSAGIDGGDGQGYTNQIYGVGGDGGTGLEYTYANTWHGGGGGGAGLTTGLTAGSSGGDGGVANDITFTTAPHGQNGEAGNANVVEVTDSGVMWAHLYNSWSLDPYADFGGLANLAQAIRDGDVVMGTGSDVIDGGADYDNLFGGGGNDTFVFELNDAGSADVDTVWDFNATNEADVLRLTSSGVSIDSTAIAALVAGQTMNGDDRSIAFTNGSTKQVTVVVKGIGRDLIASDFASAPDTTAPTYVSASVSGTSLALTYSENLGTTPATSAFTIKVNGSVVTNAISTVAIDGTDSHKLNLTLANPLYFGQTMTISYADPTAGNDANAIQDIAGNDAASFSDYGAANASVATSSQVIGSQMPGEQVTLAVGGGFSINTPVNSAAPSTLGKSIKMPLGQFAFNITGVGNGGTAQLSMTADADLKQLTYYKFNYVTNKWTNIAKTVSIDTPNNKATVFFELTDGGAYDADRTVNGTIVDPGGVAENKLLPVILENVTAVGDVTALNTDQVNGTLSYAITGGADAAKFSVNSSTGALVFVSAPNFEAPTDTGDTAGNNTYAVTVTITGSNGGSEIQPLIVTVMNVPEAGDPTVGSNVDAVEATMTVTHPNPGPTPDPTPTPTPPVDDGDNIATATEDQVPSLPTSNGATVAGDGNGDGVVDSAQANVTSVSFRETDSVSTEPAAPTTFVSLVADSREGAIDTTDTNSAQLTQFQQKDAPADLPPGVDMPLGLISFTASVGLAPLATDGTRVGITETFSLFVDDTLGINGYWKQNSAGTWVNLASDVFGGKMTDVGTKLRLDFQIQDGGEFDADHVVNGVITDPGAAAYVPPSVLDNAPHLPHDGFWF
jgi:hypothetical protein